METEHFLKNIWKTDVEKLPDASEMEAIAAALLSNLSDFLKIELYRFNVFTTPSEGQNSGSVYCNFRSDILMNAFQIQIEGILGLLHKRGNKLSITCEIMFFSNRRRLTTYIPYHKNNIYLSDPQFKLDFKEMENNGGQWIVRGWVDGDGGLDNVDAPRENLYLNFDKFIGERSP